MSIELHPSLVFRKSMGENVVGLSIRLVALAPSSTSTSALETLLLFRSGVVHAGDKGDPDEGEEGREDALAGDSDDMVSDSCLFPYLTRLRSEIKSVKWVKQYTLHGQVC